MWLENRSADRVYGSWEKFINNMELEPINLRPIIANSWRRCQLMKIDPMAQLMQTMLLNQTEFNTHVELRKNLINTAIPVMSDLYNFVKGTDSLVCLANDQGVILDVLKDPVVWYHTKKLFVEIGSDWSEAVCGTNAIGTALFEKKLVQISATEHYCKALHQITGSAAPIFGPENELLGILCILCLSQNAHAHTLGMVLAAAKAVENQLFSQKAAYDLLMAYKKVTTAIETMSEGLIAIEANQKISQLNNVGAKILQVNRDDCIGKYVKDVFGTNFPFIRLMEKGQEVHDKNLLIEIPSGSKRINSTVKAVRDETGVVTGILATLREVDSVHQAVSQKAGAQAIFTFDHIIGRDPHFLALIERAKRVSRSGSTIMLLGESGTGKEMFAQAIHNSSGRSIEAFIVINCSAIPRELVESELFGYEDGAFTGAKKGGRPGKFELADGGTIFLDEIGDMPLESQTSLLRVLQERRVTRIGGNRSIPVNTRVIAATNKNLVEEVDKGNFRLDLYYRLNVINLQLPSLRDRPKDIALLAQFFVDKIGQQMGQEVFEIVPEFFDCLAEYPWPGNVRELENVIEHALNIVETKRLTPEHLPKPIYEPNVEAVSFDEGAEKLKSAEAKLIKQTLEDCQWNITKSAVTLGIGRNTLYRKIQRYCLRRSKPEIKQNDIKLL